jgi:hypothetical protein
LIGWVSAIRIKYFRNKLKANILGKTYIKYLWKNPNHILIVKSKPNTKKTMYSSCWLAIYNPNQIF